MALAESASVAISTNPNPRDRPVARSCMILTELTLPACANKSCKSFSDTSKERLPTNNFVPMWSFFILSHPADNDRSQELGFKLNCSAEHQDNFPHHDARPKTE